jgi:hypothetical protein
VKDSGKKQMALEGHASVHGFVIKGFCGTNGISHTVVDKNNCMVKNNI